MKRTYTPQEIFLEREGCQWPSQMPQIILADHFSDTDIFWLSSLSWTLIKMCPCKKIADCCGAISFDAIAHLLLETSDQIKWITLLKGRPSLPLPDVKQINCIVYVSWTCLILVHAKSSNVDVNLVPRQTGTFTSVSQLCHVFAYLSVYLEYLNIWIFCRW